MQTHLDCISCVVRQATEAVQLAGLRKDLQWKAIKEILETIAELDQSKGPSEMIQQTFRIIRETGDVYDPFDNEKSFCMDIALKAYPELKNALDESKNRFDTAVRIAMAGNIVDHAGTEKGDTLNLFRNIEDALSRPLAVNHIPQLKEKIEISSKILYVADNAGETVFDRILIEELPLDRITYAVKGAPVGYDATLRDAKMAGLTDIVEVVEDGSDYPCIHLDSCSEDFQRIFNEADLILAKGQDNLGALSSSDKEIFFLARIRCKVSARRAKLAVGDFIVKGIQVGRQP